MIVKICETSDLHYGANTFLTQKLYDHLKKNFVGFCKEKQPDIIAICGDLYHTKLSLTSIEAHLAERFINDLRQACPNSRIILVNGTRSHDLNQLEVFKAYENENFKVYMKHTEDYYKNDFKYLVIPEEYFPDKTEYNKYFETKEKFDWVFFHGMFNFAGSYALKAGNKFNKICFAPEDFENCVSGMIVGGHIHDPLSKKNVEYCGSFERWKHGEEMTKGFRYHEYDTKTKKVLVDKFIENVDCEKFITIDFKDLPCDNLEELVKIIKEKSSGVTSLRIKVSKGDGITDRQSENLMAASLQFPNVVLYKESKIEVHRNTEEEKKEMEERRKRISEYEGLTFEQITKKYSKEVFGKTVTDEQIQEILSS